MTGDRSDAPEGPFSPDYVTARDRFRTAATACGFRLESLPIGQTGPGGEDLTIDAAMIGPERPGRVLIVSSGLHGVEGPFGSAAQLALLETRLKTHRPASDDALILLHALNPYGFAWARRFNEENVDLNRNFLVNGEAYTGSPEGYRDLDPLINPAYGPGPDLFRLRVILAILRHGIPKLKATIAQGQYDFPRGLFFGGHGSSSLKAILESCLRRWVADARSVLHVDFHTGLGAWATYKLLVEPDVGRDRLHWLGQKFGSDRLESAEPSGISYLTRGDIGTWVRALFSDRTCDYVCAEFGTYPPSPVLFALREENQAHHWSRPGDPAYQRAKRRLKEAFVPEDPVWRSATIAQAVRLLDQAFAAAFGDE